MANLFFNNAQWFITQEVTPSDTVITVTTSNNITIPNPGDYIVATIIPSGGKGDIEIVHIVDIQGSTLTLERGQEGTSAQTFLYGAVMEHRLTAESLSLFSGDTFLREDLANDTDPTKGAGMIGYLGGTVKDALYTTPATLPTDGVTDATLILQEAIDSLPDNSVLQIKPGTYRVSKNTALTGFPNNDQPCLLLRGKTNVRIHAQGVTLVVNEHAQGILELQTCIGCRVIGLTVKGPGDFPPLDGNTGRGEKGIASEGYHTSGFLGYYKNNSLATDTRTGGGFGGAFPQYGGGTASTWGMWNGGYIGNVAYGILIHNGCRDVVLEGCSASLFNYVGMGVGHNGDYIPSNLGYPVSTNIRFIGCTSNNNYDAGFGSMSVKGFVLTGGCIAENNGHPNASFANDVIFDPGYGYTARATAFSVTEDGVISDSVFSNNKRKGIDSHGHLNLVITNNVVRNNYAAGIFAGWASVESSAISTVISNNIVDFCGLGSNALGSIYVQGMIDANYSPANIRMETVISNNVVRRFGNRGIICRVGQGLTISGNQLIRPDSSTSNVHAISVGRAVDTSFDINIINNTLYDPLGKIQYGINAYNITIGNISNNTVRAVGSTLTTAVGLYIRESIVTCSNNYITLGSGGTPIAVAGNAGVNTGNLGTGGDTPSTLYSTTSGYMAVPNILQFSIVFNGTASPTLNKISGENYIDTITTDPNGVRVDFKNLPPAGAKIDCSVMVTSSTGLETVTSSNIGFIYQRGLGPNAVLLGLKTTPTAGHTAGSDIASGSIRVMVFLS